MIEKLKFALGKVKEFFIYVRYNWKYIILLILATLSFLAWCNAQ